jgi:hypothetical protein
MSARQNRVPANVVGASRVTEAAADESFAAAYCERNKDALNRSIAKAHEALVRGAYFTRDQVMSEIKASRVRRRTSAQSTRQS